MVTSMTGFASRRGHAAGAEWQWEMRAVNGKGLDLRLRVPDWIEGLEAAVRGAVTAAVQRGNVSVTLRLTREVGAEGTRVNPAALQAALTNLRQVEGAAAAIGVVLAPARATDLLAQRGVLETAAPAEDTAPLLSALQQDLPPLIEAFNDMRDAEGRALRDIIARQLEEIAGLTDRAQAETLVRGDQMAANLRDALARVLDAAQGVAGDRVAQELALIAVKADVTEEIDRLRAHVEAARALLHAPGPVGRKLDFLMQEFNREANTLCSKAQSVALTRLGLDLKALIDQMREQVQNVE